MLGVISGESRTVSVYFFVAVPDTAFLSAFSALTVTVNVPVAVGSPEIANTDTAGSPLVG